MITLLRCNKISNNPNTKNYFLDFKFLVCRSKFSGISEKREKFGAENGEDWMKMEKKQMKAVVRASNEDEKKGMKMEKRLVHLALCRVVGFDIG